MGAVGGVHKRHVPPDPVELAVAPAAIGRALHVYEQLQPQDPSVISQARKILTQHIYGMVDRGEQDEQRLTVDGLARLKAVARDYAIKSAHEAPPEERYHPKFNRSRPSGFSKTAPQKNIGHPCRKFLSETRLSGRTPRCYVLNTNRAVDCRNIREPCGFRQVTKNGGGIL